VKIKTLNHNKRKVLPVEPREDFRSRETIIESNAGTVIENDTDPFRKEEPPAMLMQGPSFAVFTDESRFPISRKDLNVRSQGGEMPFELGDPTGA
jgi:hypothetical protein